MPPSYINECLIHWTGRNKSDEQAFAVLKAICQACVLRLAYCPNYVNGDFERHTGMVCFTDIPLSSSFPHCNIFGKFGIAFHKNNLIGYGANPVFYTTAAHFERIKRLAHLLDCMKNLEMDREWKSDLETYHFNEDDTLVLSQILGFLQEYSHQASDKTAFVNYYQREWRLTFKSLPFAGGTTPLTPGKTCFIDGIDHPIFRFANTDVSYIVVPHAFKGMAEEIAKTIGCGTKIYEDEVNV